MAFGDEPVFLFLGRFRFFRLFFHCAELHRWSWNRVFSEAWEDEGTENLFLLIVVLNLLNMGYWKYTKFLMQTISDITGVFIDIPDIVLPIGISFFTFQSMSYVIDVYRGEAQVQKSIFRMGLYIPLGGSRKGNVCFHLACVFVLTGLWHGALWNYDLWGVFWAAVIVAERFAVQNLRTRWKFPRRIRSCISCRR